MSQSFRSIFDMTPTELAAVRAFELEEVDDHDGRLTIYEPPRVGEDYVIGADFALGIEGRDYDAAVVFHAHDDPPRQMATLHGHYGERFDRPLYALIRYFNGAFLMGERQYGLAILRSIVRDYGHGWVYYEQDLRRRGKRVSDRLGWPKTERRARDPLLRKFRLAVKDRKIIVRDPEIITQAQRLQFTGSSAKDPEEWLDKDLDLALAGGGSPDLVYACMYGLEAINQVPRFEKPRPKYEKGSLGDILEHHLLEGDARARPVRAPGSAPKRRARRQARSRRRGH